MLSNKQKQYSIRPRIVALAVEPSVTLIFIDFNSKYYIFYCKYFSLMLMGKLLLLKIMILGKNALEIILSTITLRDQLDSWLP